MDKLKIEIDEKVDLTIKALDEELGKDKEFSAFLVAKKDYVWKIIDLVIPEQEVSGASVDIPKKDGKSQYETTFMDFHKKYKDVVIIGTMHSHNSMGSFHSGTDDEDVENNAYLNLNEGLPFIDIVWSHEDCKAWVMMKVNNGIGRRKFVVGSENTEIEVMSTDETEKMIEDIEKKYKDYEFDEDLLKKSIKKKLNVKAFMKNIKVKKYETSYSNWKGYGEQTLLSHLDTEPSIHIEYHKKAKTMKIQVKNDPEQLFGQQVELWVGEDVKNPDIRIDFTQAKGSTYSIFVGCPSKQEFQKMKGDVEDMFEDFFEGYMESQYERDPLYDEDGYCGRYITWGSQRNKKCDYIG